MVLATKITFQLDSGLPRDGVTITPHYNGDDPQALVDRLKTNLVASTLIGATTPFTIKAYDAEKAPPSYPLAEAISGSGSKATTVPREAALCLSYYSTWNRPLYRGRLYIPAAFLLGPLALRPSDTQMANAASFAGILSNGLPQGTNWVVWSRKMAQANGVDHYWVDDEWDTVRSRGLKSTKRDEYTLPQMPAGAIYSERFIHASTPDVWTGWAVPPGKRAIVRNLVASNVSPSVANCLLALKGIVTWSSPVPGSNGGKSETIYLVAYAADLLQLYTPTGVRAAISGYLFDDPARAGTLPAPGEPPPPLGWPDPTQMTPERALLGALELGAVISFVTMAVALVRQWWALSRWLRRMEERDARRDGEHR